jgi:transcriptional regulator with XRE-family HTH domain
VAPPTTGSTVPRRQLGRSLREARIAARFTVHAAAQALEWSDTKIWRIETGQVAMRSLDVAAMCQVYGVGADVTEALKGLAQETKARGWWHAYGDVLPDWFDVFVALEGAATELRMYESELVPGLFQTAEVARAMLAHPGRDPETVEKMVLLRMQRQAIVTRRVDPVRLDVTLNESVLRRPVGGPALMAAQCRRLAELSELPNVTLRVVPFAAGWHRGCDSGPFVIMRFPTTGDGTELEPPVVYVQGHTGALYLDRPSEIASFDQVYADVVATLGDSGAARTRNLLRDAAREHDRCAAPTSPEPGGTRAATAGATGTAWRSRS